jgi:hypothetical protein
LEIRRINYTSAYLHVATIEDMNQGLKLNLKEIYGTGCIISVQISNKLYLPKEHGSARKKMPNASIVWIGNIGKDVREQDILMALSQYSSKILELLIEPVKLGCNETYGCMYLHSIYEAQQIVNLDGQITLQVKLCK